MSDFERLVKDEKYPYYNKDNLRDDDFEFVDGIEHTLKLINEWRDNQEYDEKSIFEKIRQECVEDAVEELKEYIYCMMCQYIVEMVENYENEEPVEEESVDIDVINTTCPTTL